MITAGSGTVQMSHGTSPQGWDFNLVIESAGLVSRLYRIADSYKLTTTHRFCASNVVLDAQEGKRHTVTRFTLDGGRQKLAFEERDVVKNKTERHELSVAPCTYDIVGALVAMRLLNLEPGKSVTIPITNGKKFAQVRIEAQRREKISVDNKSYDVTRYEAFLFDNVIYKRKARLLIWMSNDPEHVPVQMRILTGFPIGTITVSLQKQEKQ